VPACHSQWRTSKNVPEWLDGKPVDPNHPWNR
jgi:hypothetical protein